jgi:hypothetical protein
MGSAAHNFIGDDRYLILDDTDEDASQILTVICEGRRHSSGHFDTARACPGGAE